MPKILKQKLLFLWKDILFWPVGEILSLLGIIRLLDWFGFWEKWGIKIMMAPIPWQTEVIITLVVFIILIIISAYRSISRIEKEKNLLQDDNFMSLKEACDMLKEEKEGRFGTFQIDIIDSLNPNQQYDKLGRYFIEVDDIYGKSPSSIFLGWKTINNDKFYTGAIKIEKGELVFYGPGNYVGKTPEYI